MRYRFVKLCVQFVTIILMQWKISNGSEIQTRNLLSNERKHNIIKYLPGFPGKLPFHLETGYVGVGEKEEVQLFYYFCKSERNPLKDPLFVWLCGGPGCSSFSGLALQIGPMLLDTNSNTEVPSFKLNPFSWTKVASIVFLDSPVGAGFSYATTDAGYYTGDLSQSDYIYKFLQKWLADYTEYTEVPLYIAGDSYSGMIVPVVVQNILNGNKADIAPRMNLKGYILGNPFTRPEDGTEMRFEYAERVSLLSTELYELTKHSCNGDYEDPDVDCGQYLQAISYNLDSLYRSHILQPNCLDPKTPCPITICDKLLPHWANSADVRLALQIREGTKREWVRCNKTSTYEYNVESAVGYHQNFTKELLHALVFSGDQDKTVSYVGTLKWIMSLQNITILEDWVPWLVDGQIAGYATKFRNVQYDLTFSTVKGGGHLATLDKGRECLDLISRWLAMDLF